MKILDFNDYFMQGSDGIDGTPGLPGTPGENYEVISINLIIQCL